MSFLYETHMHTRQASKCGVSSGAEHVRRYRDLGFDGIIITDHFWGGNCAIPRDLPWTEWVNRFCAGYEDAWNEGQKLGFPVFFGWEQNYDGDEYLIYGPQKDWLLAHPEIVSCSRRRQLELVHEAGGCVIQAHPFRARDYIRQILLGYRFADGVEIANCGNRRASDVYAWRFALEKGLYATAGSDNHNSERFAEREQLFGVRLETPLRDMADFARRVLRREKLELHVPESRFAPLTAEEWEDLPAWELNADEQPVPSSFTPAPQDRA